MIGETFMHIMVKEMQTFIQQEHFTLIKNLISISKKICSFYLLKNPEKKIYIWKHCILKQCLKVHCKVNLK